MKLIPLGCQTAENIETALAPVSARVANLHNAWATRLGLDSALEAGKPNPHNTDKNTHTSGGDAPADDPY